MPIFTHKPSHRISPKQRKGEPSHDQFGKAEKKLVVCNQCHNARFGKKWHAPSYPKMKEMVLCKEGIHMVLCPACTMKVENRYEGEIIIDGVPLAREAELIHLITVFGARAKERDPQDRVILIAHDKGGTLRITTTENQLAVRIAKKIKSAFKKTSLTIRYSKEPFEVVRVHLKF